MSTTTVPRFHAVLDLPKATIPALLAGARTITTAMAAETATFPSPNPLLAIVLGQINTLDTAQQAVVSGLRGAATSRRNTARDLLWSSLLSLKLYVQTTADPSMEHSFTIIKSSGFTVRAPPSRSKPVLGAKLTVTSGEVRLRANVKVLTAGSSQRATYNWQYSVDGGHTWVSVISTPVATTTIGGLPAGSICSFRVSVTLKQTMQPWSQVVTIPVH
jgi:hypothetical protein